MKKEIEEILKMIPVPLMGEGGFDLNVSKNHDGEGFVAWLRTDHFDETGTDYTDTMSKPCETIPEALASLMDEITKGVIQDVPGEWLEEVRGDEQRTSKDVHDRSEASKDHGTGCRG